MKERHFELLSAETGIHMALTPVMTFGSLLKLGIQEFEELVKTVADNAAKEYATEHALHKMIEEWESIVMEILPYKDRGEYTRELFITRKISCCSLGRKYWRIKVIRAVTHCTNIQQ